MLKLGQNIAPIRVADLQEALCGEAKVDGFKRGQPSTLRLLRGPRLDVAIQPTPDTWGEWLINSCQGFCPFTVLAVAVPCIWLRSNHPPPRCESTVLNAWHVICLPGYSVLGIYVGADCTRRNLL